MRKLIYRPPCWILPTQYYYKKRINNIKYITTKWLIIMLIYHYFRYSVHYTFYQQNLYGFIFSSSFSSIRTHSNGMVSAPFKRYNMIREKALNNKMDQIKFYHITRNLKANFVEWILVTFMRTLLSYACYLFWGKGRWQYFSRYLYPVQSFHLFHSFVFHL